MVFYRGRFVSWQMGRGASIPRWRKPRNCADARYLANLWAIRSYSSRLKTQKHWAEVRARTLRDFEVAPGNAAWRKAVKEAQRAYPGSEGWLMSCSASEGGWGRWVGYSGVSFSYSLIASDTVGGWLQFRPSTYRAFSSSAIADVRRRGFIVPQSASSWLSPLGQALSGGWALRNGLTSHWSGHGC